jgi:hypothetical protein
MRRWRAVVCLAILAGSLMMWSTPAVSGGPTTRVVSATSGDVPVAGSDQTVISGNGRYVVFIANADELPGMDGITDVYVRDVDNGTTRLASKTSGGTAADGPSLYPSLSGDGLLVAFQSTADNLPSGDGTTQRSYVRDQDTDTTRLVSKTTAGVATEGNRPSLSRNGRFVTFSSDDPALPGDDGITQVYVRNLETQKTTLVSKTSAGVPVQGSDGAISTSGRFVAFVSSDPDLPGATAGQQIYVHDRQGGTTELVSRTDSGDPAEGGCSWPAIAGNGLFVGFYCYADNLPGGDGLTGQVYVHDRQMDDTEIVSVNTSGDPADDTAYDPSLSNAGRYVTFYSMATNLPGNADEFDAYRHDRDTGKTIVVSKNSAGDFSDGYADTFDTSMSMDGRWVAFRADGDNMPGPDTQSYIRGPLG